MRFLRRAFVGLFMLSLALGLLAASGASVWEALEARRAEEPGHRPQRERVFAADVIRITPETVRPVLETFGEVRAIRRLEMRATSAGRVVWVSEAFEEGGRVAEGEVLLRVDPADATAARDTAAVDLADAEVDLADAERALALAAEDIAAAEDQARLRDSAVTRQRDLLERGVGSAQAVETAELAASSARQAVLSRRQSEASALTRVEQARSTLQRRRIALAEAERRLAETEITAAFDGVLSDVAGVSGKLVSSGERLAELIDPSELEVAFRISTRQHARLLSDTGELVGADVEASAELLGVDLVAKGQITRESPAVGEGETGRLIFARLDENPGFRPGDFVAVRIVEPELSDVARLPASAVDASGTLLRLGADDRLETAKAEVLRRQGDDVLIEAGNLAGVEVVAALTPLLGEGIRIRPVRRGENGVSETDAGPETIALDPERRARLVAFVEANEGMPAEAKQRVLAQLRQPQVPARVVERIEERM